MLITRYRLVAEKQIDMNAVINSPKAEVNWLFVNPVKVAKNANHVITRPPTTKTDRAEKDTSKVKQCVCS